jgi:hypothetical protein
VTPVDSQDAEAARRTINTWVEEQTRRKIRDLIPPGVLTDLTRLVPLEEGHSETFTYEDYGWTEHQSRKWGQWDPSSKELLAQMRKRGFDPLG